VVLSLGLGPITALAQVPQPGPNTPQAPSVQVDPGQPGTTPHWTITLFEPYCGGYKIGDGVYLSPESPLALPQNLPDGSVLFAGQPASATLVGNAVRVAPAPGVVGSMICMQGNRSLTINFLPQAGLTLPDAGGTYALDYWTGADPTLDTVSFEIPPVSDAPPADAAPG
jgi:hypothetical protein